MTTSIPDLRLTAAVLWRVTDRGDPYFAKGSFWALRREDALEFQSWWEKGSAIPEDEGQRQLYSVEIDLTADSVFDFRRAPGTVLVNTEKLVARIDDWAAAGFQWVVFFGDSPWPRSTKLRPEAIYLGDESVPATPA